MSSVVCVLVRSSFRSHVAKVAHGPNEGLQHDSAANCDTIVTLPTAVLAWRRRRLGPAKLARLDRALAIALGLA